MITPEFKYAASLVRVVDGDTYVMDVDLGFNVHTHITVRLRLIDVYEHNTPIGQQAKGYVVALMSDAKEITLQSYKDVQSFARWVCDLWVDGASLAETLRAQGFAKPAGQEHLGKS